MPEMSKMAIGITAGAAGLIGGYLLGRSKRTSRAPSWADKYCKRVLYTAEEIEAGIDDLAAQLNRDYSGKASPPLVIGILSGVYVTLADLTRKLAFEHDIDFVKASSYGDGLSSGDVKFTTALKFDVTSRDIILVDELIDTAKTFSLTVKTLKSMGARTVKTVCVVDKTMCHTVDFKPDYCALKCPNEWVFGYGLDCKERLRSLPYIGIVTEEFKKT